MKATQGAAHNYILSTTQVHFFCKNNEVSFYTYIYFYGTDISTTTTDSWNLLFPCIYVSWPLTLRNETTCLDGIASSIEPEKAEL